MRASSRSALLFLTPSNFNGSQPYFLVKGIRFLENVEEREIGIEKLGQSKERTEMPPLILNGGIIEMSAKVIVGAVICFALMLWYSILMAVASAVVFTPIARSTRVSPFLMFSLKLMIR
jgi:hypothetical protein